jgi:hypothetical protein
LFITTPPRSYSSTRHSATKVKLFSDATKHFNEKVNLQHENSQRYMADITGAFEVDGLVKQKEALESLLMSNPAMEKVVHQSVTASLTLAQLVSVPNVDPFAT